MIRDSFKKYYPSSENNFRLRGEESSRIENFSDALFALAITLLLISTSAPTHFNQVKKFTFELIPFCISILMIMLVWHQHFIFFLRYGLRNNRIIWLNTLLMFITLFYVYPLKFLAKLGGLALLTLITNSQSFSDEIAQMISGDDVADLMIIYGFGVMGIFLTLAGMYQYALKLKNELELNELEIFETKASRNANFCLGMVAAFSVSLAVIFHSHWFAGMISGFAYFANTIIMTIMGGRNKVKRKALLLNNNSPEEPSVSSAT